MLSSNWKVHGDLTVCLNCSDRSEPRKAQATFAVSDAPPQPAPLPAAPTGIPVYTGPPLESIKTTVATEFQVRDAFLDPYGIPTIHVTPEPAKKKFQSLLGKLRDQNLIAAIRSSSDGFTIKVFKKPPTKPPRNRTNLILFVVTVVTVLIAGYFLWVGFGPSIQQQLTAILYPTANPIAEAGVFAGALIAIVGLHEFGHKAAAQHHKMDATLPYFIPGPPPIGTFGALISLRSPPANRDQLFDLGLSGPVVGLVITIIVAALSVLFGLVPTPSQITQANDWYSSCINQNPATACGGNFAWPAQPLILIIVTNLAGMIVNPNVIWDPQLFFAAQIGALLTFLNIVPAWQLDGGHISRAVYGPDGHRVASVFGLIIIFWSGYWTFGILILAFMYFSKRGLTGVEPLDDISPLSVSRKLIYLVAIAMLILTFAYTPFRF